MDRKEKELILALESEFSKTRVKSKALYEEACNYLPGGDTRTNTYFSPFPHFIQRGEGAFIYDVDGNKMLDMQNNFTSLIHGHKHEPTIKAIVEQAALGSAYSSPLEKQIELAKILTKRYESIDLIRFTNSGTEAVINAMRIARAFTNRQKVVKAEGAYHGTSDIFETGRGASRNASRDLLSVQFNDIEGTRKVIKDNHQEIACFILEPVMASAGQIVADIEYLKEVRELTESYDILLIFDEIVTGRLSYGGAQELFGVSPDLTTLGKIIGGGMPIGAFGGREDIMKLYIPKDGRMVHSGTFNGNAVSMAAGVAAMTDYDHIKVEYINQLGEKLKRDFLRMTQNLRLRIQINGIGSLYSILFSNDRDQSIKALRKVRFNLNDIFFKEMMSRGIYVSPKGMLSISTSMNEGDMNAVILKMEESLKEMMPVIKEVSPDLVE